MLHTLFENSISCYQRAEQWHALAKCHQGADWRRRGRCEKYRDKWIAKMVERAQAQKVG